MSVAIYAAAAVASACCAFAGVSIGVARAAASRLVHPPRKRGDWDPGKAGLDFDRVEVGLSDGVKLRGWFVKGGSEATVIAIHGYTASKWDLAPVIELLAREGFNVLALDCRAHGESDGDVTKLGYREAKDFSEAITWLRSTYPEASRRIGVIGYSMGGAITIMLTASDDRVDAAVADSPYIDIVASGRRWIENRVRTRARGYLLFLYPLIVRFAASMAGVDIEALRMYRYASSIRKPLLIIAGRRDDLVALEEIQRFFEEVRKVNDRAELWVTDAEHVKAYFLDPSAYRERVVGFFRRWLLHG